MKTVLPLAIILNLGITSCGSSVKMVEDTVKKNTIYQWSIRKITRSKLYNVQRYFDITVQKNQSDPKNVNFMISSAFPVTESDFQDTAYIVAHNTCLSMNLDFNSGNIYYKENINTVQSSTTTDTKTTVQKNPESRSEYVSATNHKEKTDTKTTTSTTTKTDTRINAVIIDKVLSKRVIRINTYQLKKALDVGQIYLRHAQDGDHWDITFSPEKNNKIRKVKNSMYDVKVK